MILRKRTILILTSKDEVDCESQKLADAIKRIGTHNVVVMSDDKYGSASKMSALDRLMDNGAEYQYLLMRKDRSAWKDVLRIKPISKRTNRIKNMVKRFRPEYILCITPYAHHCAVEAKRRTRFKTQIIYLMHAFTLSKRIHEDDATNVYIVENADIKADLVRNGIKSKDVLVMGLPFDIQPKDDIQKLFAKQEMGLPKTNTVFVNIRDKHQLETLFRLLIDQGDMFNYVVYCPDQKVRQELSNYAQKVPEVAVLFLQTRDRIDECLSVASAVITQFEVDTIYKCFKLGVVPIILSKDEHVQADVSYLLGHELCMRAKCETEAIASIYKAIQTSIGGEIAKNGRDSVENTSLENIANFLVAYVAE